MQRSPDRERLAPPMQRGDDPAGRPRPRGPVGMPSATSRPRSRPSRRLPLGLLAAAASTGALTVALAHRALHLGTRAAASAETVGWSAPGTVRVEDVVELGAVVVGAVLAAWFCLGLTLAAGCAAARSAGRAWGAGERLVARTAPGIVRRALVVSAGTGVALAGATLPAVALATPGPEDLGWSVTTDGGPATAPSPVTPDAEGAAAVQGAAPVGSAPPPVETAAPVPAPAPVPPPAPAATTGGEPTGATVGTVVVTPGDTLWDIACEHLPASASTADVAAAWPAWYAANEDVIGADPDLILPGQRLTAPGGDATTGADR